MSATCDNCGESHGPDDLFCERCGYDFITGSLPEAAETNGDASGVSSDTADAAAADADQEDGSASGADQADVAPDEPAQDLGSGSDLARAPSLVSEANASIPQVRIAVGVDQAYFDAMVTEGEVTFPDPAPPSQVLELFGSELHIGRTSESRAVHPNIDVEALTGDPAVSTRHAVLRVANDGAFTLTDVGSTNGTFVDDYSGDPITQGVPVDFDDTSTVYLGAWTMLSLIDD